MSPAVRFQCPHCRQPLGERHALCSKCGAEFPSVVKNETEVVDFLGTTAPHTCTCWERGADRACAIDLAALETPGETSHPRHGKAKVLRTFRSARDKVILDVGCRDAPIGRQLADHNTVIGLDMCPRSMLAARYNALDGGYAALAVATAENIPLEDASVDIVLATDLVEHLLVPEKGLREFRRVLKPDGRIVVTVPNLVSLGNRLSILFGYGAGLEPHRLLKFKSPFVPWNGPRYPDQWMHLRWFTKTTIVRVLRSCGFVVESVRGYDPVFSRLPLADRILRGLCALTVVHARPGDR